MTSLINPSIPYRTWVDELRDKQRMGLTPRLDSQGLPVQFQGANEFYKARPTSLDANTQTALQQPVTPTTDSFRSRDFYKDPSDMSPQDLMDYRRIQAKREKYGAILDAHASMTGVTSRRADLEKALGIDKLAKVDVDSQIRSKIGQALQQAQASGNFPQDQNSLFRLLQNLGIKDIKYWKTAVDVWKGFTQQEVEGQPSAEKKFINQETDQIVDGYMESKPGEVPVWKDYKGNVLDPSEWTLYEKPDSEFRKLERNLSLLEDGRVGELRALLSNQYHVSAMVYGIKIVKDSIASAVDNDIAILQTILDQKKVADDTSEKYESIPFEDAVKKLQDDPSDENIKYFVETYEMSEEEVRKLLNTQITNPRGERQRGSR